MDKEYLKEKKILVIDDNPDKEHSKIFKSMKEKDPNLVIINLNESMQHGLMTTGCHSADTIKINENVKTNLEDIVEDPALIIPFTMRHTDKDGHIKDEIYGYIKFKCNNYLKL